MFEAFSKYSPVMNILTHCTPPKHHTTNVQSEETVKIFVTPPATSNLINQHARKSFGKYSQFHNPKLHYRFLT